MDSYILENEGKLTCSKLKLFRQSREAYYRVYELKQDTSFLPDSKALRDGNIIDKYVLTRDEFYKEFAVPAGKGLKSDLIEACLQKNIPLDTKETIDSLEAKLYGNKDVLTLGEYEKAVRIDAELQRQPLFDYNGDYDKQKELVVNYKGLKLKGKLDRYSLDQGLIRDLKTTSDMQFNPYNIDKTVFENKLTTTDEYDYALQLARYWLLANINSGGKDHNCIIDAVGSTGNYAYEGYYYHSDTIKRIANHILFPLLEEFIQCKESGRFIDEERPGFNRLYLINNRYYPMLDSAIQKEFRVIEPTFI